MAINGSNAFFTPGGIITGNNGIDAVDLSNTYLNFKGAGAGNDCCYLRQIGTTNEAYKLAFDFHDDDNDARFCIRSVRSAVEGGVDIVREVFTVDMGNVSCMASLYVSGTTTLNNATTLLSSLNVSGTTPLNNATTLSSSLNVVGNLIGSGAALKN